jgi:hypothetical protein
MQKYILITLFVLHLIPIWAFRFIPTQDGLSHVYNAYVLKEYNNPEYTKFREVYHPNVKPFPNWGAHAFFFVTLHIMPPLLAEKLYVTLCVVLLPISFLYFLKKVNERLMFFGLLGFLYSYNYLLHMGSYGFALSVSFYFLALGYWWGYRHDLNLTRAAVLYLLIAATYFSHLFSYAMLLLSLSLLALTSAVLPEEGTRTIRERGKSLAHTVAALVPAYSVFLYVLIANPESKDRSYRSFRELWSFFGSVRSLVSFNDGAIPLMWCLLGFIGGCFLWTIIRDKIIERDIISQRDGFIALFCISTLLYFKLPWAIGPPAWINDRMHFFLFPILLAWFSFTYPKWLKYSPLRDRLRAIALNHCAAFLSDIG